MKLSRYILAIVTMAFGTTVYAQRNGVESPFLFESTVHDFGTINEADGIVTHSFPFVNKSNQSVMIESISTSCGCTTVSYQTSSIEPGKSSEITVSFNPARTEGKVFRDIEIISMGGKSYDRLELVAEVVAAPLGIEELFPVQISESLRTSLSHVRFGYASHGHTESKSIVIVNTTESNLKLKTECRGSGFLKADSPRTLKPGTAESIILSYTIPANSPVYGTLYDTISVYADGKLCADVYYATAIAVDDFDKVSNQDLAPHIMVEPTYYDFKTNPAGKIMKRSIEIENTGKQNLIIRAVECGSGAAIDLPAGTVLTPGEKRKVNIAITTPTVSDEMINGMIDLITNDPMRPKKELRYRSTAK